MNHLQQQLEEALAREDYEQAAALRNRIAAGDHQPEPVHYIATGGIFGIPEYYTDASGVSRLGKPPENDLVQQQDALRQYNIDRYNDLEEKYRSQLIADELAKIQEQVRLSEKRVHDELEKRIKLLFPKKQARWIAKNIVCVIDHRDNSRRYVAQDRCILEVKYTINGVDL
jgi:hypothetical protein